MTKRVAIIGSGISGSMLAYELATRGHRVTIYERGMQLPDHLERYRQMTNRAYHDPMIDRKFRKIHQTGENFFPRIENEIKSNVGGMAMMWEAITPRLLENDFMLGTRYGRGIDWPVSYAELEPYYGRAEHALGVSGTDEDNPFAPFRSTSYPLPPFELSYEDQRLAEQFAQAGLHVHTTPQARTRAPYHDRLGCQNTGICEGCPFDARYSPSYHLNKALATGHCTIQTEVTVRSIVVDAAGVATGLQVQKNGSLRSTEEPADLIIVAAGAIETARLLLLSTNPQFPDGLGNQAGHLGQHLTFHVLRQLTSRSDRQIMTKRAGFWTGQSMQFADHDDRSHTGALRIETARPGRFSKAQQGSADHLLPMSAADMQIALSSDLHLHELKLTAIAESQSSASKYMQLSTEEVNAFGDPVAHVHYELDEFDERTFAFTSETLQRFAAAADTEVIAQPQLGIWTTAHHHMSTARMAENEADGVVDKYGRVFGTQNVFTLGASRFSNTMAINPTLTIVALTLLTSDYLLDQVLAD